MIIHVKILNASATKSEVVIQVKFTAIGGSYNGASLNKEFIYTHPTSGQEIVAHLTDWANLLKISLTAPEQLVGMEFDV